LPLSGGANMVAQNSRAETGQVDETHHFVERALLDFGLLDTFGHRSDRERAECLRWIASAQDGDEEEDRVSCLLDALASGGPLVPSPDQSA
jgi:hypothetical protein